MIKILWITIQCLIAGYLVYIGVEFVRGTIHDFILMTCAGWMIGQITAELT